MKKKLKNISVMLLLLLPVACTDHPKPNNAQETVKKMQYTCPMHPQVLEDHPGTCPICGMTLVKKTVQTSADADIDLHTVLMPVNSSVVSSLPAVSPVLKIESDSLKVDGYLDFDTRTFNNIAARFSGRIEKLYIKYAFEEIHSGEHIMDIYSPEMVTAQQDLIYLVKNSPAETSLIHAAGQKLLLLGMTTAQVAEIGKTGRVYYSLPIYSPYNGHVHDVAHSQMSTSAESMPSDYAQNLPLPIKEGVYVEKGQTLFNVVDPHRLWAILKIRQSDAGLVTPGQAVSINIPDQDIAMNGKVNFIVPALQAGDKATSVRVYLGNMSHKMKVGSLLHASIATGSRTGLWLPRTAVIGLGQTKIAWLKKGNAYRAQQVQTGIQKADEIQITGGLTVADSVAVNGQYLADSEDFIKTKSHE
jgi:membrane fusion protein, copper/silver efflux system